MPTHWPGGDAGHAGAAGDPSDRSDAGLHTLDAPGAVESLTARLPLVDHHCHSVVTRPLDRPAFEGFLTEASGVSPLGTSLFDTQTGFAVRRWCAPVLGLRPHAPPDVYLTRRAELGGAEVARLLLRATGVTQLCVDDGYRPEPLMPLAELTRVSGTPVAEVVRLEQVVEDVLACGVSATTFADAFRAELDARTAHAVAVKSIAAYRSGLGLPGLRPSEGDVRTAAARALASAGRNGRVRVSDPVLHAFAVWAGADLGLPVQFHTGLGDADVDLRTADPLLLTPLLRELAPTGVPVMLLHTYPFHRSAGHLAQVFPNVFLDIGLTVQGIGRRATAVLGETLELAPFGRVLYASDAFALPELHHVASVLFRRALGAVLAEGVAEDAWTGADAARVAELICSGNARRVYGI